MAIVSLFNWMGKFGYSGDFYDIDMLRPSKDEMFNYFKSKQPDVVGISAVISTSYLQVKTISKIIRKACPSAWIVLGGNMAATANVLLRKTEVAICVLGDGEKPWVSILDYLNRHGTNRDLKKLLKIKGIAILNEQNEMEFTGYGEPIPDNENPFPDYELLAKGFFSKPYLIENYFREAKKCSWFDHDARTYEPNRKPKLAMISTGKGCVARCTFCQRFCKGYHPFDLKKLDSHLAELKVKYNVQFIQLSDESFGSNKKFSFEVAKILKKHDMLWFSAGVRCTSFTLEDLKFLNDCGCAGIKFGVESGSQKILDIMEKKFTTDDVYTALKNCHECNILAPLLFCIGMPGETDCTVMETSQFLEKIARMQDVPPTDLSIGVTYAQPLPGSPLYEYGQLQGIIGSSVDEEEAFLIYISGKGSNKRNFVNLTGSNTKKALFWDFLLYYEAMRTFYRTPVKKQVVRIRDKPRNKKERLFITKMTKEYLIRGVKQPITALNWTLFRSHLTAKIPRPLLYLIMRNLSYAEYFFTRLLKMFIKKDEVGIQFKKRCEPLMKAQSLREINQKIREIRPAPRTLTEKNQQILYLGR